MADDKEDIDDKPCFELYIKASQKDKENKGSCPICQQWFMVAYILAEKECVSFKVFTVIASSPPASFQEKLGNVQPSNYPVIIGVSGYDNTGASIETETYHHTDDVSGFFERVNGRYLDLNEKSPRNCEVCGLFLNLQRDFNSFLRDKNNDGKRLLSSLRKIDEHLKEINTKFLLSDDLSFADCSLLPKLHHIRIAGGYWKEFVIPEEFTGVWNYLENAYATNAFIRTMPTDQDIIIQHADKIPNRMFKKSEDPRLQPDSYTTSVVHTISVENHVENGTDSNEENRMPSPDSYEEVVQATNNIQIEENTD